MTIPDSEYLNPKRMVYGEKQKADSRKYETADSAFLMLLLLVMMQLQLLVNHPL